ncbi:MAG: hypothetical protein Fur0015_01200 [Ignavibacteriales bacterium]
MIKVKLIILLLFTTFFYNCNDQVSDPINNLNQDNPILRKIISPYFTWTTYTYWDDLYRRLFTHCSPDYSFSFMNFNYSLNYSTNYVSTGYYQNNISVNVNGNNYTTITWYNTDKANAPRTIVSSLFNVNGKTMSLSIDVNEFYTPMRIYSEPFTVRVAIQDGR